MNTEKLREYAAFLRKHLFCSICGFISVACLAAGGYLWQDTSALNEAHDARSRDVETMLATFKTGPQLRAELANARERTRLIDDNLARDDELPATFAYFEEIEKKAGTQHPVAEPVGGSPAEPGAFYKKISYTVHVTGTFPQIRSFIYGVETGKRLVNISSFSLRRAQPGSSDVNLVLNLDFLGKL